MATEAEAERRSLFSGTSAALERAVEYAGVSEDTVERRLPKSVLKVSIPRKGGVAVDPKELVTVSYFEWVQNRSGLSWSAEEVADRLRERMLTETATVWGLAEELNTPPRVAAYVHALRRIGEAVDAKGSAEIFSQRAVAPSGDGTASR